MKKKKLNLKKDDSNKLLTKRPEYMLFKEYKKLLREQKIWIEEHLIGRIVYLAVENVVIPLNKIDPKAGTITRRRTYKPFVGSARYDL